MSCAAVVLAAGAGRRLGTVAKALLRCADGRTFLQAVRDVAMHGGVSEIVVVVGPPHDAEVRGEAARLALSVIQNASPERGMASSVALGFAHALAHFTARIALLWPVDHPFVRPDTVQDIIARTTEQTIVTPVLDLRGGHPAGFGRSLWPELARCASAPEGARSVIRAYAAACPDRVIRLPVTDLGVRTDVDTLGQLPSHVL